MVCGREREAPGALGPRAPRRSQALSFASLAMAAEISPFPRGERPGQAGGSSSLGALVLSPDCGVR